MDESQRNFRISVVSLFPRLYEQFVQTSLIARAQEKGIVSIDILGLFSYVEPKERVDGPTFGHGAGMIIRPEVIERAVNDRQEAWGSALKIFFSPQGKKLDQRVLRALVEQFMAKGHMLLMPARYEGIDARAEEEYGDEIISAGDFVLMGGDVPAMMLMEGVLRLIPGVVGREESVKMDSFSGPFVDYPEYTAPVVWRGRAVPEVIRSGNHELLLQWRQERAIESSVKKHFNWVRTSVLSEKEEQMAARFIPPHYVALLHNQVLVSQGIEGSTSVTSIDIHDLARSAKTFGVKQVFIVTSLIDQQKIVKTLLDFWQKGAGIEYNQSRHKAVKQVKLQTTLDAVIEDITAIEGKRPLVITTSAQTSLRESKSIGFDDQQKVWNLERPVLLVFGTGQGLAPSVFEAADFTLIPVHGFSDYNHLSVRSAAAIVLDRWLGISERLETPLAKGDI